MSCVHLSFVYHLWRNVSSRPLPMFYLTCWGFLCVGRWVVVPVCCGYFLLIRYMVCKCSHSFCRRSLHSVDCFLVSKHSWQTLQYCEFSIWNWAYMMCFPWIKPYNQVYESVSQKGKKYSKRILLWPFWDILIDLQCSVLSVWILAGWQTRYCVWSWDYKDEKIHSSCPC